MRAMSDVAAQGVIPADGIDLPELPATERVMSDWWQMSEMIQMLYRLASRHAAKGDFVKARFYANEAHGVAIDQRDAFMRAIDEMEQAENTDDGG